jgi:hypothetical protein
VTEAPDDKPQSTLCGRPRRFDDFPIYRTCAVIRFAFAEEHSPAEEGTAMNVSGAQSETIKTLLKGAAIGFLLVAVGGQFWPGYMLDSNVKAVTDQVSEAANNSSASLLCQEIYMNAPDGKVKLVALRALDSYRISQDADVAAAATQALKLFADAKISPEPSSYRVKSDCGDQLYKKPSTAALLK